MCTSCGLNNYTANNNYDSQRSTSINIPLSQNDLATGHQGTASSFLNITTTLSDIRDKLNNFDEFKHKIELCLNEVQALQLAVANITGHVESLRANQQSISNRCDRQEQRLTSIERMFSAQDPPTNFNSGRTNSDITNRDFELIITGIPNIPNESLLQTLSSIANAINVAYSNSDVASAVRIRSALDRPKPIVVRFTSVFVRDSWLTQKRIKREMLASDITTSWPSNPVYINERSTKEERRLLKEAKDLSKQYGFRFVWMRRGNIFIKQDENARAVRYTSAISFNGAASSIQDTMVHGRNAATQPSLSVPSTSMT